MAADSDQQILAQLQFLNQTMKKMVGVLEKPDSKNSKETEQKKSAHIPDMTTMQRLQKATMRNLAADITQMRKDFGELGDGTTLITKDFKELAAIQSAYAKSVITSSEVTNSALDGMTEELKRTINTTSAFAKGLVNASSTTAQVFDQYEKITDVLDDYNDILKKYKVNSISNIQNEKKREDVLDAMYNSIGKLGDQAKAEFASKIVLAKEGDKVALQQIETQMRLLGVTRDNILGTIEKTAKVGPAISTLSDSLKKFVSELPIAKMSTFAGSFALFTSGAKGLFQQFQMAASSGFGNSLFALNKGSMTLGISVEALTKILNSNRQQLNKMGMDDYIKSLKTAQIGLMRLGLTSEQAAAFQAHALSLAQTSGVALSDTANLSKVVNAQTEAFETLRAVTGTTAEEFASLQKSLMNDQNMRISLARLDAKGKAQMISGILMEQQRLTLAGLNNEQMTKMIQANQTVLGQKVADRMQTAAKMLSTASMMGMGDQGMEAYNIILKGRRRTDAEAARLSDISANLRGAMDTMGGGNIMSEHLMDQLGDNMDPAAKELLDAGRNLNLAASAMMGTTVEETKRAKEQGKISEAMAKGLSLADQLGAVLSNPLMMIAGGLAGMGASILGMRGVMQAGFAQLAAAIGKGSVTDLGGAATDLGDVADAGKGGETGKTGKGGRFGKVAGVAGKVAGVAGKVAGVGLGAFGAIGSGAAAYSDRSSDVLGGMMGIGGAAMLGPVVGGITAAISGFASAYKGWNEAGDIFKTEAATTGQKFAAAAGGFLHGVTFGLFSTDAAAEGIYAVGEKINDMWAGIQSMATNMISWIGDKAVPNIESFFLNAIQLPFKGISRMMGWIGDSMSSITKSVGLDKISDLYKSASSFMTDWSEKTYEAADFGEKATVDYTTAADYGAKAADNNKKAAEVQAKALADQKAAAAVSASNLLGTTNLAGLSAQSVAADMEVKKTATATATTAATQAATVAAAAQPAANGTTINNANKTNGEVTNADLYKLLSDILAALLDGQMISTAQLESLKSISGNTKKNIGGPDLATFVAN